jgi:hypothetical protein
MPRRPEPDDYYQEDELVLAPQTPEEEHPVTDPPVDEVTDVAADEEPDKGDPVP